MLGSAEPDSTLPAAPTAPARRRHQTWLVVAGVAAISVAALLGSPALAGAGGSHEPVVVCESGVEVRGSVAMSAATAFRIPDDHPARLPAGCYLP
jgi:hypothetical protein